jgi:putative phosphoesterase
MLIGLISDTHMPVDATELPPTLRRTFRDVDLILHAGDVYAASVLSELETIAPLLVSKGDDDYGDVLEDPRMKETHTLTFEGITLRLIHEFVIESCMNHHGGPTQDAVNRSETPPDIIIHGHTHKPALNHRGAFLTVTPGSATFPNYVREPGTVGLLTLTSGKAEAQIIQL